MSDCRQELARVVSVIIPAYNATFIEETLASVYAQTVTPDEVIVVNDGSSDDTEDRLRQLAPTLPPTFLWQSKPHGGAASARNAAIHLATGDYIAFLDADDIWYPEKLERQLEHFASDPYLTLSFTAYKYDYNSYRRRAGRAAYPKSVIHHDSWDSDPDRVLERLLTGEWPIGPMSVVMIRRDALLRTSLFDEHVTVASDIALYLELAVGGMKLDYLPEPLVDYRWHGSNLSRDVGRTWEDVSGIYDRFWERHADELPEDLRPRAPAWRAHWHLLTAIDAIRRGDKARARRHIVKAARAHPSSIRPGWLRMLGIGPPPAGPWPD